MAAFVSDKRVDGGGSAAGGSSAPHAASALDREGISPPLTNRGCLTPKGIGGQPVVFHIDYLKVTIFSTSETVLEMVETGLMERAGLPLGGWVDHGPAQRWENIYRGAGPIMVLVPKDKWAGYCIVELKGEGCEACGAGAIFSFLNFLTGREVRWQGCRIDLAFDHVQFTPHQIDAAARVGDFNSRCFDLTDRDWNDNISGQTAYLGPRAACKTRRLRVYNKRGYNRCEAEITGEWARSVVRQLSEKPPEFWPTIAVGVLRGMVDFIDRKADPRAERCSLLPWWAEFVGGVERVRNLPEQDRPKKRKEEELGLLGKSESRIMRCARSLWPLIEAFGSSYVTDRIDHYAAKKITDEDRDFSKQLAELRYCGFAGLPDNPPSDDIPF